MRKILVAFLIVAVIAVVVHFLLFKMRYGWYTSNEEATFLNVGFFATLLVILFLWAFYPTRIGVALAGIATIVFPFVLRPQSFPTLNWGYVALSLIPLALLVFATYLRQRSKVAP